MALRACERLLCRAKASIAILTYAIAASSSLGSPPRRAIDPIEFGLAITFDAATNRMLLWVAQRGFDVGATVKAAEDLAEAVFAALPPLSD